jgi:hypothetical protein
MQLYIHCHNCRSKINLNVQASTRPILAGKWGAYFSIKCPVCGATKQYHVNEVTAEGSGGGAVPGALIGGLLGILGGPIGLLIGGTVGGAISNSNATQEIDKFNNSYY